MSDRITPADIVGMIDVLSEVAEQSDSMEADEAIALMESMGELISEARRILSLVETAVKNHLEAGAREIGGRTYVRKAAGKWRAYHDEIASAVIGQSVVDTATGELRDAKEAASVAVAFMRDLYVSPSVEPKKGGLKRLGLDLLEVSRWEKTGTRIEVIDNEGPEG